MRQGVANAKGVYPRRESMVDRAESWLGGSNEVTNAVVLVDVDECCETGGVRVMVQLWRRGPVVVRQCGFVVRGAQETWVAREEGFPEGVALCGSDLGGGEESFLLPMWWLRNEVVANWAACRAAVEAGKRRL